MPSNHGGCPSAGAPTTRWSSRQSQRPLLADPSALHPTAFVARPGRQRVHGATRPQTGDEPLVRTCPSTDLSREAAAGGRQYLNDLGKVAIRQGRIRPRERSGWSWPARAVLRGASVASGTCSGSLAFAAECVGWPPKKLPLCVAESVVTSSRALHLGAAAALGSLAGWRCSVTGGLATNSHGQLGRSRAGCLLGAISGGWACS